MAQEIIAPTVRIRGMDGPRKALRAEAAKYGLSLVQTVNAIAMDTQASHADRLKAIQMLWERGFGKPTPDTTINAGFGDYPNLDQLDEQDTAELFRLLQKASGGHSITD